MITSLPEYKNAKAISIFISHGNEIDTSAIIQAAFNDAKRVFFPTWRSDTMKMRETEYNEYCELIKIPKNEWKRRNGHHIPMPNFNDCQNDDEKIDLYIVPGLAFCADNGGRLGYGMGHYDRYFASVPDSQTIVKCGVCFEEQILPLCPAEHDIHMDLIVTQNKVYRLSKQF